MLSILSRLLLLVLLPAAAEGEVVVAIPSGGGIGLSTRGKHAFRVRFLRSLDQGMIDSPMVAPDAPDAAWEEVSSVAYGTGIRAKGLGYVYVSPRGRLCLLDPTGRLLTRSERAHEAEGHDSPAFGVHGDNVSVVLQKGRSSRLYGRGAANWEGDRIGLLATNSSGWIENKAVYVPHYYSTEGYAAFGVGNVTQFNKLLVSYAASPEGTEIAWTCTGSFELYLMPAATFNAGTQAYLGLLGSPRVPPLYTFGFIASRWGWSSREYVEEVLQKFRDEKYPIDAFIVDFEWFADRNDYSVPPEGADSYDDFGYNPSVFPGPKAQLAQYRSDFHVRFGGIRKPRLGNSDNLKLARASGWMAPDGGPETYAPERWVLFEDPAMRKWYQERQAHYLEDGVDLWWNDEGENSFYTYHWWNVAQSEGLPGGSLRKRFYSLNRAFTPGMARLGAHVWTGDVKATWEDLSKTPGMMLNWGLAGAPYVACDIGGFWQTPPDTQLLPRWFQVGVFLPIMRVHSVISEKPHFPWLWGEKAAVAMREAMEFRYRLIPYHYSLAHAMYATGSLWMRPLVMDFPNDERVADMTSEWMDGEILAAPVLRNDSVMEVYLPEGTWYALGSPCARQGPVSFSGKAALGELPAFVRAGAVVPLAPLVQHTEALPGGPLEVQVYAGKGGSFDLVEDDGETMAYETAGVRSTSLTWDEDSRTLSWKAEGAKAGRRSFTELYVTLFNQTGVLRSAVARIGSGGSISASQMHKVPSPSCKTSSEGASSSSQEDVPQHRRLRGLFT